MAYVPQSGSVVVYESLPSSLLTGSSIYGQLPAGTALLGSVATIQGTNPWIITGSVQTTVTTGNSSVQLLNSANVVGSIATLQGTSPWNIAGSVAATIQGTPNINTAGSVVAFQGGSWNPSVSGTVGASIIGLPPVRINDGTNLLQIYEENNIDTSVTGIAMMFRSNANTSILSVVSPTTPLPASVQGNVNVAGSVLAQQLGTHITSVVNAIPSSMLTGASIFGQLPGGTAVLGSVAALQGTSPWIETFSNASIIAMQLAGSILATSTTVNTGNSSVMLLSGINPIGSVTTLQGTNPWIIVGSVYGNVSGSVIAIQTSVGGTLVGNYAQRNDTVASFLGGNLTWNPLATDSAGRGLIKPFSSEDGTIISYSGSVVSASVTLIQASAIGKRNYITDFLVTNTGSVAQLITFQDGSTSILGYTIAPAGGGSNAVGWNIPMKTANAQDLAFKATGTTSVLYMTVKGYQAQ